jgi:hypothetical protein
MAQEPKLHHDRLVGNPQQGRILDLVQNVTMPRRDDRR